MECGAAPFYVTVFMVSMIVVCVVLKMMSVYMDVVSTSSAVWVTLFYLTLWDVLFTAGPLMSPLKHIVGFVRCSLSVFVYVDLARVVPGSVR